MRIIELYNAANTRFTFFKLSTDVQVAIVHRTMATWTSVNGYRMGTSISSYSNWNTLQRTKVMVFCQDERMKHIMNLPPQPPLSEEPEQPPTLHSSEETPTQPAPASDSLSEEPEQPPAHSATEDIPPPPASSSEPGEAEASELDEVEFSELDEDEAFAPAQASPFQPSRSGVFIHRGILIAATCALVVAVVLVALLVFVNRPKDPPTDWIASYTPPAGTSSAKKILYYLHWTNQNGELKGQLQLAANVNGSLQSLTALATGLYNRDNHIIYVVVTINGQADTLMGKINDNNDTLTLNPAGATGQDSQIVFHIGSANDYKQATKKLGSGT
jgi:hypothetical protein